MRTRVAGMDAVKGMEETEGPTRGGNAGRKKGTGVRAWLVIDAAGETQLVEAGKHAIMSRTGLPARDMRILDPQLSYLSTILGRERAIVVNLEHIKAIITAEEVLLLNPRDPAVAPLVAELQRRLPNSSNIAAQQEGDNSKKDTTLSNEDSLRPDSSDMKSLLSNSMNNREPSQHQNVHEGNFRERPGTWKDALNVEMNAFENCGPKVLPFEFRALEACLEATCSCLESETCTLEEEAYPTMDELTSKISTLNLGKVRQIKSRLVAISGRVQKVRDALEDLLDDDEDMAEMYLTDKLVQQRLDGTSSLSSLHRLRGGIEYGLIESDAQEESGFEDLSGTANILSRDEDSSTSSSIHSGTKRLDVEELEMLLEAYFVQIDGTLNKLSTLREYVDDTEDYINIMLDDKQNQLLQMGVMLTLATLAIGLSVAATAVFGMNITITITEQDDQTPPHYRLPEFLWTVGGCVTGSTFLYIVAIAWCKHRRLLML